MREAPHPDVRRSGSRRRGRLAVAVAVLVLATPRVARTDQVIADDLIVQGSTCIGIDCINNEDFSFDTLRFRENNLRIKFDDTSSAGTFPTHDWQLVVNDSTSDGLNRFSIQNDTTSTVPFTILGGAPTDALFVDAAGKVGIGTSAPAATLGVAGTAAVSGALTAESLNVTGTVNGRNVAADGALLDALVAAAAADTEPASKAGSIPISEFSRANPRATVTFATPWDAADAYVVIFTVVTRNGRKPPIPSLVARDAAGFTVALGTRRAGKVTEVQWVAQRVGE